jgi:hypothetical protein
MKESSRIWTLVSFITGVVLVSIALTSQSKLYFVHNLLKEHSSHDSQLTSAIWHGVINDLLKKESNHISGNEQYANDEKDSRDRHPPAGLSLPFVTRYEFDLTLAGDSGKVTNHHRNAFMWITAHIINDLQILNDANVAGISINRRLHTNPVGLLPYYRSSGKHRDSTDNTKKGGSLSLKMHQKTTDIGKFNYILESDINSGRLPIMDLMDETSYMTSECALDSGCKRLQILMYVPPLLQQPLYMISSLPSFLERIEFQRENSGNSAPLESSVESSVEPPLEHSVEQHNAMNQISVTGISITGTAAVVIANFKGSKSIAKNEMESTVRLLRSQIKDFLGLLPSVPASVPASASDSVLQEESSKFSATNRKGVGKNSDGILSSDITYLKAIRSHSMFQSASLKLKTLTMVHKKTIYELIQSYFYAAEETDFDIALNSLIKCEEMVMRLHRERLRGEHNTIMSKNNAASKNHKEYSDRKDADVTVKDTEDTVDRIYSLCLISMNICNTLSVHPDHLFPSYFPLDQRLIMYAPYWLPLLVPIIKGIKNLRAA